MQICGVSDLNGRKIEKVYARTIIFVELKKQGYSLYDISDMCKTDYQNVAYLIRQFDDRVKYDKEFKNLVDIYYGDKR